MATSTQVRMSSSPTGFNPPGYTSPGGLHDEWIAYQERQADQAHERAGHEAWLEVDSADRAKDAINRGRGCPQINEHAAEASYDETRRRWRAEQRAKSLART